MFHKIRRRMQFQINLKQDNVINLDLSSYTTTSHIMYLFSGKNELY